MTTNELPRGTTIGDADVMRYISDITSALQQGVRDATANVPEESAHRFDGAVSLYVGRLPILYEGEVLGFVYQEDEWIMFETASPEERATYRDR